MISRFLLDREYWLYILGKDKDVDKCICFPYLFWAVLHNGSGKERFNGNKHIICLDEKCISTNKILLYS